MCAGGGGGGGVDVGQGCLTGRVVEHGLVDSGALTMLERVVQVEEALTGATALEGALTGAAVTMALLAPVVQVVDWAEAVNATHKSVKVVMNLIFVASGQKEMKVKE